jgi:hypothetical protein
MVQVKKSEFNSLSKCISGDDGIAQKREEVEKLTLSKNVSFIKVKLTSSSSFQKS